MRPPTASHGVAAVLLVSIALAGCGSENGILQPPVQTSAKASPSADRIGNARFEQAGSAVDTAGLVVVDASAFSRLRGGPRTETHTVQTAGYLPDAILRVRNGDETGAHRVSSAAVSWDGRVVAGPSAFSQSTSTFDVPVKLGADHSTLSVRLAGAPGGRVTVRVLGHASVRVLTFAGGNVVLTVPWGAAPPGTDFTASPSGPLAGVAPPVSGAAFAFGPHGTWAKDLDVSIAYDPAALPPGVRARDLGLFWYDGATEHWQPLDSVRVDAAGHRVSGAIGHFTTIAVVPDTVRVCPGDPSATPTLDQGLATVADGGTVLLCDATHPVENQVVSHAVTIRPDGAFTPTIQGSGNGVDLDMENTGASLTLEGLHFSGAGDADVRLVGALGDVTIHGSSFAVTSGKSGVNALGVTGGTLLVQRDTFAGGGWGVNAEGGAPLHVYDDHFIGQTGAPIQLSSGAGGEITGNTTAGCGQQCVALYAAGATSIRYNIFKAEPDGTTQYGVLADGGGRLGIGQNTFDRNSGDSPQMVFNTAAVHLQDVALARVDSNYVYAGVRGVSVARPNPASGDTLTVFHDYFGQNVDAVVVEGSQVAHLSDNKFLDNHGVAIAFRGGGSGVIGGSEIGGCGPEACIQLQEAGTVTITTNLIQPDINSSTNRALDVRNTVVDVVNNTIDGSGGSLDPADPSTWPMHDAIIRLDAAAGSTVTGNDLYTGYRGIAESGAAAGTTIHDNRISEVAIGVEANDASPALTRNDITNYTLFSLAGNGWTTGSATCDWWGSASGPSLVAAGIGSDVYTPVAAAAIAGTGNSCP